MKTQFQHPVRLLVEAAMPPSEKRENLIKKLIRLFVEEKDREREIAKELLSEEAE